jgi:hypothetical protein
MTSRPVVFGDAFGTASGAGLDLAADGVPLSDKINRDYAAFSKASVSSPVERMKRLAQWERVGRSPPQELRRLVEWPGPGWPVSLPVLERVWMSVSPPEGAMR